MRRWVGACISTSGSVANHCTNWKMASLYMTNEMALLTEVEADESSVSLVVDGAAYTCRGRVRKSAQEDATAT